MTPAMSFLIKLTLGGLSAPTPNHPLPFPGTMNIEEQIADTRASAIRRLESVNTLTTITIPDGET